VSLNIKKCTNVSGRALHLCTKAHCHWQWAFVHRWRALPETYVHFLMFNDTSKSFPLTFYCFYSVTHLFSFFLVCEHNVVVCRDSFLKEDTKRADRHLLLRFLSLFHSQEELPPKLSSWFFIALEIRWVNIHEGLSGRDGGGCQLKVSTFVGCR